MDTPSWIVVGYLIVGVLTLGASYVIDRTRGGMMFRVTEQYGSASGLVPALVLAWPVWLYFAIDCFVKFGYGPVKFRNTIQTYRLVELDGHGGFRSYVTDAERSCLPGDYSRSIFEDLTQVGHYYEVECFTGSRRLPVGSPWKVDGAQSITLLTKRGLARTN